MPIYSLAPDKTMTVEITEEQADAYNRYVNKVRSTTGLYLHDEKDAGYKIFREVGDKLRENLNNVDLPIGMMGHFLVEV